MRKKEEESNDLVNDTVGVWVTNSKGDSAVASSTGGPWMKLPGRVSMVSSYGAGSYTEKFLIPCNYSIVENKDSIKSLQLTVSATISGYGDKLMTRLPAYKIVNKYKDEFMNKVIANIQETTKLEYDTDEEVMQRILKRSRVNITEFINTNFW